MKQSTRYGFRPLLRAAFGAISRAPREEGAALFEVGMMLPVLSMLLLGIIWGGITFFDYVTLADAVAAGARTLATGRGASSTPCTGAENMVTTSALNLPNGLYIAAPTFAGASVCENGTSAATLVPGDAGTITATYPCNMTIPFANISLCPVQGTTGSHSNSSCPNSPYCISSTTTVYIQ